MEGPYIKFIRCGEVEIAASCEDKNGEVLETYLPCNILFYTHVGQLNVKIGDKTYHIEKDHFGLLRKHTFYQLHKSCGPVDHYAKTYAFALTNKFLRKVIQRVNLSNHAKPTESRYLPVPNTKQLKLVMNCLIDHVDNGLDLDESYVEEKTFEALEALIHADRNFAVIFKEYSLSERADLEKLMNHNYLYNIPLGELANRSGRSLSTFNRDFRMIYNDTPHHWIMNKRLEHARNLMITDKKRPSAVFLQSGFEDLAHFSRAFKKKFKVTPSAFYRELTKESVR